MQIAVDWIHQQFLFVEVKLFSGVTFEYFWHTALGIAQFSHSMSRSTNDIELKNL